MSLDQEGGVALVATLCAIGASRLCPALLCSAFLPLQVLVNRALRRRRADGSRSPSARGCVLPGRAAGLRPSRTRVAAYLTGFWWKSWRRIGIRCALGRGTSSCASLCVHARAHARLSAVFRIPNERCKRLVGWMEASVSDSDLSQSNAQVAAAQSYELSEEEQAQLKTLDESLAKFEGLKRWSDVIKTRARQGRARQRRRPRRWRCSRAPVSCTSRSPRTRPRPSRPTRGCSRSTRRNLEAITHLKDMYEKRRDWEKLVDVMRLEIELMDELDRPAALRRGRRAGDRRSCASPRSRSSCGSRCSSSTLATRRPSRRWQVCTSARASGDRWPRCWSARPSHIKVENDLVALLLKLGGLYGDKLNDDRGAVRAFKRLLDIRPDERRAQEQLKKRYAALRDWDALETFYATTDKWDELIRVFEREGDDANVATEERISLLKRVARLWAEKKDKPDRAARSYEKILELAAGQSRRCGRAQPDLRAGPRSQEAGLGVRGSSQARRRAGRAPGAPARDRPALRGEAQGRTGGVRQVPGGVLARAHA